MASSYPNAPSEKIQYDQDGSIIWRSQTSFSEVFGGGGLFTAMTLPPTEITASTEIPEMNDEDNVNLSGSAGGPSAVDYGFAWIWPEKRDIYGLYVYACNVSDGSGFVMEVQTSTESRNGITGSWTTEASRTGVSQAGSTTPVFVQPSNAFTWNVENSYREFIHPLNSTGNTSSRFRISNNKTVGGNTNPTRFRAAHWYGSIADGANPDRFLFIDADTGLEFTALQDWGDIPRGSVHEKDFWLYNNSATLSASSNVLNFEGLYGDSYTWYDMIDHASTAPTYSTQITVDGPITPGSRYPASTTITLRLTVDPDEDLGPASARLKLDSVWS